MWQDVEGPAYNLQQLQKQTARKNLPQNLHTVEFCLYIAHKKDIY